MNIIYTGIRKIVGGYGRLYNWWCTQPQTKVKYGYLYNWYAAVDSRNIAASNARLPSIDEYMSLQAFIGGASQGGKLRESTILYWDAPNTGATNETGFNLFGAGMRSGYFSAGDFTGLKGLANLWTSTPYNSDFSKPFFSDESFSDYSVNPNKDGLSIRLIVVTPIEISGSSAIYIGNDLKRYKCCLINGIWYTAENLAETKYRNGDLIPKVTDNTAWSALTTGAMCAYDNLESNAFETASIAPAGWHVPTRTELQVLETELGGFTIAGGKLKEIGILHWNTPNTGADNSSGFKLFGSGARDGSGNFSGLKDFGYIPSSTLWVGSNYYSWVCEKLNDDFVSSQFTQTKAGVPLRLIKNDSTFTPGDTITDIDGNIYPLVKIGTQVWTAKNWKCQHYNDGTPIPLIEDNTEWASLTTGAQCVYNNDIFNL